MLLTKEVDVTISNNVKRHYIELGYIVEGTNPKIRVKVEHLTKGSNVKVKRYCDVCGNISDVDYRQYADICKKCADKSTHSIEAVKKLFKEDGCELLETNYRNNQIPLKFSCENGHVDTIRLNDFMSHRGSSHCKICNKDKQRVSINTINKRFEDDSCTLLSKDYKNNQQKLHYVCSCGRENWKSWQKVQANGTCCKFCKRSKGESKISNFLIENKIKFDIEKKFDNLKSKKHLKFDFYLPDHNMCIEFDGEQHFRPVDRFGGIKEFKYMVKRDLMKDEYCVQNKIHLIRISYKEYNNIDNILNKQLGNYVF